MSNPTIQLTYQDYRKASSSETERYELLDGELRMVPAPGFWHQDALFRLAFRLEEQVRSTVGGKVVGAPLDVILSEHDVVQPDLIWLSPERSHIIRDEGLRGAPDLVVEVLSPSTRHRDRAYKRELYRRHGVKEVWFVSTERKWIEVLSLCGELYQQAGLFRESGTLRPPLLPNLAIDLGKVFN